MVQTDTQDSLDEVLSVMEGLYFKAKMQLNLPVTLHVFFVGKKRLRCLFPSLALPGKA